MTDTIKSLDDLNYFWMDNGAPCFIAQDSDIFDQVESIGFSIYYVLCNEQKITTTTTYNKSTSTAPTASASYNSGSTTVQTTTYKPKLFKVVSNFVGRSVAISEDPFPSSFAGIEEQCVYNLPLIPLTIVNKLDEFFRLVHAKHGTESIVILTFDPTKDDSSGWGVLVPEQTNTGAHCSYDAESVVSIKPDHVMIVGSVHSHPEMSAYASGTDHADQADFDGVHITYGWQKTVNNGATQYHLELQMSGKNFTLKPEDVFENFTYTKEPDPEVVEWAEKVKKALPPSWGGTTQAQHLRTPAPGRDYIQTGTQETRPITPGRDAYKHNLAVPNIEPDAVLIAEIYLDSEDKGICPSCEFDIDRADLYQGSCSICNIAVVPDNSSMHHVAHVFMEYCKKNGISSTVPAYVYAIDNEGDSFLIRLNLDKALSGTFVEDDDYEVVYLDSPNNDNLTYDFDPEILVCCGQPAHEYTFKCKCKYTLFYEDFSQFDKDTKNMTIYEPSSKCQDCENYYTPHCPALKDMIYGYTTSNFSESYLLSQEQIKGDGCPVFVQYHPAAYAYNEGID